VLEPQVQVSVLMSVYAREKPEYLDLSLSSVESQTLKPVEIVLVEDGPLGGALEDVVANHVGLILSYTRSSSCQKTLAWGEHCLSVLADALKT